MKKLLLILGLVALSSSAWAQSPGGGVKQHGSVTPGNCTSWFGSNSVQDAGAPCGSGSGSVSVTAGTPDIVLNPTPGTGTFTVGSTAIINAQGSSTAYTVLSSDMGKVVTHAAGSTVTETLPRAGTTGFATGVSYSEINLGAGSVVITPTTSTINGAATLTLTQNQSAYMISDGTNWVAFLGAVSSGGSGTVNSGAAKAVAYYAGAGTAVSGSSLMFIDSAGVGIGTSTPAAASSLDIYNTSGSAPAVAIHSNNTGSTAIQLFNSTSGGHTYQFFTTGSANNAGVFGIFDVTSSTEPLVVSGGGNWVQTANNGTFGWNSSAFPQTSPDTGLSRLSAAVVGVGNGTNGNVSGSLDAARVGIGTTTFGTSSILAVNGAITAGTYAGTATAAISNGLIISGQVGIGTSVPSTGASLDVRGPIRTFGYTVGTLPSGVAGMVAYVTDQLTTCAVAGAALTGGGSVVCPVFYNGSAWVGN